MSRIGKLPIDIPETVKVSIENNIVTVNGPLWTLTFTYLVENVKVEIKEKQIIVTPLNELKESRALWGTTRSILDNLVEWVTKWFSKSLEIQWVGYKFDIQGSKIVLSVWFSHKVEKPIPQWITVKTDEKSKNIIHANWIDKQQLWEFCAQIRSIKKPEPYKWKWIRYLWEHVRRKAWKTGKK